MNRKHTTLFGILFLLFAVAACGDDDATSTTAPATTAAADEGHAGEVYVVNAGDFAGKEAADWDNAEVVRVELSEFAFTPSNLTFEAGKPYILQLVNVGAVEHELAAEDFFSSVAWRKIETAQSEVKAPFFTEVEVFPGQQVDLYFVPILPTNGEALELLCEIEGHFEAGMFGSVTVTGTAPTSPAPLLAPIEDGPWQTDGADLVAAADWDSMETVTIELSEFTFGPDEIRLTAGQPYRIVFENVGVVKHEATAPELFQHVAFRKVEDASGEYKGPAPLELEVFPGATSEMFIIPQAPGTYQIVCEIEGHFEAGMFGNIIVDA